MLVPVVEQVKFPLYIRVLNWLLMWTAFSFVRIEVMANEVCIEKIYYSLMNVRTNI